MSEAIVPATDTTYGEDSVAVLSAEEFAAHCARVESVFTLVEKMMVALANNPMFAGFLPPDLQREIKGL